MLPYQMPKARVPMKAGTPKEMRKAEDRQQETIQREEWQRKKEAVRKRLGQPK